MSTEPRVVDAHQHVWDLSVRPQGWTTDLPAIDRTFTFDELRPQLDLQGVAGTLLVETVNVAEETPELLALAASEPRILGVVGWLDLTRSDVAEQISRLRGLPGGEALVGLRHQVQGEEDPEWLLRADVLEGLRVVGEAGLVFELLVTADQLPAAVEATRLVTATRFVLSHLGKPPVESGAIDGWAADLELLAQAPNVAAKLSGLVTEAAADWTVADLQPYADVALDAFGPERLMAGSDWPVCLLRAGYADVWRAAESLVSTLSTADRAAVLGGTATHWYGLR